MPPGDGLTRVGAAQAAAVLGETRPALLTAQDAGVAALAVVTTAEAWLTQPLAMLTSWVIGHLTPVSDALNTLVGDPAAITAHTTMLDAQAEAMDAHVTTLTSLRTAALEDWQGPGADLFAELSGSLLACERGYGDAARSLAGGHLTVALSAAATKEVMLQMAATLVPEVIKRALLALAVGAPLGIAVGVTDLAGGLLRAASDLPLVGGLFGRGADAADQVEAALQQALADFCVWAANAIAQALEQYAILLQQLFEGSAEVLGQVAATGTRLHRAASLLSGNGDPGPGVPEVAAGSPGAAVQGADHQQRDTDVAHLQAYFNNGRPDPTAPIPPPYEAATPEDLALLGITPDLLTNDADGFAAGVYKVAGTSPPQFVVPFAGTQDGTDMVEDGLGGFTVSPQSRDAIRLATAIADSPYHDQVVYSGHSLGGRLAAVASVTSGNGAVTFNAAGVSPATIDYLAASQGRTADQVQAQLDGGQVRAYRTGDDPLTYAQERAWGVAAAAPDAPGAAIDLRGTGAVWTGHGMAHVAEQMDRTYGDATAGR